MADYEVTTYQDLIDSLVSYTRGGGLDVEQRDIRMAARDAYKNVCLDSDFPYLLKHHRINFEDDATGTIDYDHAASGNIEAASNATPIVVTSRGHNMGSTCHGRVVTIRNVGGNTAANGTWNIVRVDDDSFQLVGSAGNGAYTSGGTWTANRQARFDFTGGSGKSISSWTNSTPLTVTTSTAHGYATGDAVMVYNATGRLGINKTWIITVVDTTNFTLDGSVYEATPPAGGNTLKFDDAFPTWAEYGRIIIDSVVGAIRRRLNDAHVEIDEFINWGGDKSDESFTIYKSEYLLPADFKATYTFWEPDRLWSSSYIHPDEWLRLERVWQQAGGPFYWTILPDCRKPGRFVVAFHGYPDESLSMDFLYYGIGRDIRYTGYETRAYTGTVTATTTSTTVTGSSTQWTRDMEGSLIRFSLDTGEYPTGIGDLNMYGDQRRIIAVHSATQMTIDEAPSNNYSATLYRISDPLDVDNTVEEAVKRGAEHEISIKRGGNVKLTKELYNDALYRCLERNSRSKEPYCKGGAISAPWVNWASHGTITNT